MMDPVLSSLLRINRQRLRILRCGTLAPHQYVGVMHLIVFYVGRTPGASQEEITGFYALDKASVARGARRLEEMGHIRRELSPEDHRQYQLFLTEAGREMLEVLYRADEGFQRRLSDGISPEDWKLLAALLERVEKNITRPPAPEPLDGA